MTSALVIVDIQNDYFAGGNMPLEGSDAAAANAARLLAGFRSRALPVIHVRHAMARPNAGFLMPGTAGAEIHASVAPLSDELILVKRYPNSFRDTGLLEHLRTLAVERIVVAGMMTHMCIDTTVRAAFDLGFEVALAHDACATRALAFDGNAVPAAQVHRAFLAALHGLFADVRSTREVLAAM